MPKLNDILYEEVVAKQAKTLSEVTVMVNEVANHLYTKTGIIRRYPFSLASITKLPESYWEEKIFVGILGSSANTRTTFSFPREKDVLACIGQCGKENNGYMLMFTDCLYDQRQAAVVLGAYTEFLHPEYFIRSVLEYSFGFSVANSEIRGGIITSEQASGIPAFLCEECYEALLDFPGSGFLVGAVQEAEEEHGERMNTMLELMEWWYPQLPQRRELERFAKFSKRASDSLKEIDARTRRTYSFYLRKERLEDLKTEVVKEIETRLERVQEDLRNEMVGEFSQRLFDNEECIIKMEWDERKEEYTRGAFHKMYGVGVARPNDLPIRGRRWLSR